MKNNFDFPVGYLEPQSGRSFQRVLALAGTHQGLVRRVHGLQLRLELQSIDTNDDESNA